MTKKTYRWAVRFTVYGTITLILAYTTGTLVFSTWNMKGYFDTIPIDLEEAAMTEGQSRLGLIRILFEAGARLRLDVNDGEVSIHAIFPLETM